MASITSLTFDMLIEGTQFWETAVADRTSIPTVFVLIVCILKMTGMIESPSVEIVLRDTRATTTSVEVQNYSRDTLEFSRAPKTLLTSRFVTLPVLHGR